MNPINVFASVCTFELRLTYISMIFGEAIDEATLYLTSQTKYVFIYGITHAYLSDALKETY